MNILVACEYSQEVCKAFRDKGHNAYSCDLLKCEDGHPEWHIISNSDEFLKELIYAPYGQFIRLQNGERLVISYWDMVIGHPPCTRLTNSVYWFVVKPILYNEVKEAAEFFNMILNAPAKYVAVENPVMNEFAQIYVRRFDQSIQPYEFNEDASKRTCLWLRGLPCLEPTGYYPPRRCSNGQQRWGNQTDSGQNKLSQDSKTNKGKRAKERSKTYAGIAKAMAEQWG